MTDERLSISETISLGVIVEKRRIDHPWAEEEWRAVAVIPGAPERAPWTLLREGERAVQYHAATLPLTVHRAETEAYLYNLEAPHPSVFVVMRRDGTGAGPGPFKVAGVTVSPYEAQDYLDSGEEEVERLAMPGDVRAWLEAFVATRHREEPFVKRKRDKVEVDEHKFGQEPIMELRRRTRRADAEEGDDDGR